MDVSRKAYHHGHLRESLLTAAEAQLEQEGPGGLSLRKLGRQLGVTAGAPYRHFEHKDALLGALAVEGFRRLRAEMLKGQDRATDGYDRLKRAGIGYLRFATRHPELFRLMFGWMPAHDIPELYATSDAAFAAFKEILQACEDEGLLLRENREAAGLLAWSAVHGAAFLLIDGRIEVDGLAPTAEYVLDHIYRRLWFGIGRLSADDAEQGPERV